MSSLIFIISSYLPAFGSVYCSFSSSLGDRLGCLFEIFFFFFCGSLVSLWTPLLELLLLHLIVFVWLRLHCHLFRSNSKISSLISLLTQWSPSSMLFSLCSCFFSLFSFCGWCSTFMLLWSGKMLEIISVLFGLLTLVLCPRECSVKLKECVFWFCWM